MYDITLSTTTACGEKLNVVYLRHAPNDADKLVRIAESMQANGWMGRPVILQDCGDHIRAFTGTHRLAACINSDVEVEAVWLPANLSPEHCELLDDANDDLDLMAALKEIDDERGDMGDVVAVMQAEVEAAE